MERQRRLPRLFWRRGWTRHRSSSDVLCVEPSANHCRSLPNRSPEAVAELRRASRGAATAGVDTAIIPEPLLAEPVGVLVPYLRSMGLPSVVV
jgi:hypothetical protein